VIASLVARRLRQREQLEVVEVDDEA